MKSRNLWPLKSFITLAPELRLGWTGQGLTWAGNRRRRWFGSATATCGQFFQLLNCELCRRL